MEKNDRRLVKFIVIIVLTTVVVETANYLIPIPTAGSVTVTDEIGDAHFPELKVPEFMDIVEATVQKNEANITVTIRVNGDIPNQTESNGENVTYRYSFKACLFEHEWIERDFINLDLKVNEWIPELGRSGYRHSVVDYAGEDFPGSFTIDQRGRMIQIILDLNLMKEKDIWTNATSEPFSWFVGSEWEFRYVSGGSSGSCDGVSDYFPDHLSFLRRTLIPQLILISFAFIALSGVVWWWIGKKFWKKHQS